MWTSRRASEVTRNSPGGARPAQAHCDLRRLKELEGDRYLKGNDDLSYRKWTQLRASMRSLNVVIAVVFSMSRLSWRNDF
jgi:hypothetical protein